MGIKFKILYILLISIMFLLTPKNIFAQGGVIIECACGTTPDGLDCMTCGTPGDVPPSWQRDGPNDCPGGCCVGGQCSNNCSNCINVAVNCPAGSVKSTTVVSNVCPGEKICGLGTAQSYGYCCRYVTLQGECGEWYHCPTFNHPDKLCRDCEKDETYCSSSSVVTYTCTPTCPATYPSNLGYSNDTLTWTAGTGGLLQYLYVSKIQSDVLANCGTGTSCSVNTTLSPTTSSYSFSPVTWLTLGNVMLSKAKHLYDQKSRLFASLRATRCKVTYVNLNSINVNNG